MSQKMNTGTLLDLRMVARNDPGSYPYDGELYAIYLLENYQRQGIGNQLVRHVV
ncbi:GNAT family N-acetyltransferase [Aeribacillus pallidus]|uniref:GNAT family N-acetyltransferase n=1 Tax=Aeribacillus pallidus TaxID=33936 RepID=UPI003D1AF1C0